MLKELKQEHGRLGMFLVERGCNFFVVKYSVSGAIRNSGRSSFWVRVKRDSDLTLDEFKCTQFFTREEKLFLEGYTKEKYVTDGSYKFTRQHGIIRRKC